MKKQVKFLPIVHNAKQRNAKTLSHFSLQVNSESQERDEGAYFVGVVVPVPPPLGGRGDERVSAATRRRPLSSPRISHELLVVSFCERHLDLQSLHRRWLYDLQRHMSTWPGSTRASESFGGRSAFSRSGKSSVASCACSYPLHEPVYCMIVVELIFP